MYICICFCMCRYIVIFYENINFVKKNSSFFSFTYEKKVFLKKKLSFLNF